MSAVGSLGLPRSFYPTVNGGKYHQASKIISNALCNSKIMLDMNGSVISYDATAMFKDVHPIVCRKCLTKATGKVSA